MAKRFLIVGLGRFGQSLAETLVEKGCEVIAVDRNMANVAAVKEKVTYAIELDATDTAALRAIDCLACQAAIVSIGENFEAAVLCVAALKEAGMAQVVARARNDREARILTAVGASRVIELEVEMGRRLGTTLANEDESRPLALPRVK